MKLCLIAERKSPPDRRAAFTPEQCRLAMQQLPGLEIMVESSSHRCFADDEYQAAGVRITNNPEEADVLLGVKEVPPQYLIANKTYLYFSHTIKQQPYNRHMLQEAARKNITLVDYECLTYDKGGRVVGFGHWAGIVGTYNALLIWGKRTGNYSLKPAYTCHDYTEVLEQLRAVPQMDNLAIAYTGEGRVASGIAEVLEFCGLREVSPREFLQKQKGWYFCHFSYERLYTANNGQPFSRSHFFNHHNQYTCTFRQYLTATDMLINGMYWEADQDILFKAADVNEDIFGIQVIADISCDINGSVPITIKDTTIESPVYGYKLSSGKITTPFQNDVVDIMAVSNLPAELPRDASQTFGDMLLTEVLPEFFKTNSSMLARASVLKKGKLGNNYQYLQNYLAE